MVEGLCYPLAGGRVRIVVNAAMCTRAGLLGVLAHEMIHQYQHQHGLALDHGTVFLGWQAIAKEHWLYV